MLFRSFTGGIGERAAPVRAEACRGLGAFGIELDASRNLRGLGTISAPSSKTTVRVVAADEDAVIARHAWRRSDRSTTRQLGVRA